MMGVHSYIMNWMCGFRAPTPWKKRAVGSGAEGHGDAGMCFQACYSAFKTEHNSAGKSSHAL